MTRLFKLFTTSLVLIGFAILLQSCKKDFDQPPGPGDPNLVANTTIQALKAMHTIAGAYDVINTNIIISGVVIANDKSGNFYKQLWIRDSTGGLQVLLDANSLYATYPVGRKVFIKCNGLTISDYNRTMELGIKANINGAPSLEGIPANLVSQYVLGGSINNPANPIPVTLAQLGGFVNMQDRYLGELIQLQDYEFADTTVTYSDTSVYKSTTNRTIKDCGSNTVIIRTSAYSNFAGVRVPGGNGSIAAIYTAFGNTKQLILRDTSDVHFTNPRCSIFEENFEGIGANNATLVLPGWKNIGEVGGVLYQNAVFGPVKAAKISAFNSGVPVVTSWLISPAISLSGIAAPKLTFMTAGGFLNGNATFKAYISTNYNGGNNPSASTWTLLPATIATAPSSGFGSFISSGVLSLAAYANQTVYIGFKYDGGDPGKTTTYELDDVKILR
ncbi:MAG: DUF5689 domain-containing protein [Ferruginibacter sp.]